MASKGSAQYTFHLPESISPTYFNIARYLQEQNWQQSTFKWFANFSEKHFQFDPAAAQCLEYKNLLHELVAEYQLMPIAFCINDQNWLSVLDKLAKVFYTHDSEQIDHVNGLVWILKPATLNNGKHIKIFQRLSEIEQHYLSSNRLGGEHVLQQYVNNPHLLQGPAEGHKYSVRMFVVITNYAGAYLYPHGYFNIAMQPYQPNNFADIRPHLTNEHLIDDEINVIQIPTPRYDLFKQLYPQIKLITSNTIAALQKQFPNAFICRKNRALAIYGFDFMVDANEKVWLLEANHGPCFPKDDEHPLQKSLYYDFWQSFITSFVMPIAAHQPIEKIRYSLFESL